MAISVKFKRTTTTNTFVVTAGSGDTGKLQIQLDGSDVYNNLSGSSSDIISGAASITPSITLDDDGNIPQGVYYFKFVASVGTSAALTTQFLVSHIEPSISITPDTYTPELTTTDNTSYSIADASATSVSRTLTLTYPTGSNQTALTASAAASATSVSITTSNVWTGANQVTLDYDLTYTVTPTSSLYSSFTYQETGVGYESEIIEADNALCTLYCCIDGLRKKVKAAASGGRANYPSLLSDYTYACSLAMQYREAISCNKTAALDDIYAQIEKATQCTGCTDCVDASSTAPTKIYGIGNSTNTEEVQDIVGTMFENGVDYGITATYDDTTGTVGLENWGLYLQVYNDTGSTISKGKVVYISGYDTTTGLPEVSLASPASSASAQAVGLISADIASAASGRCVVSGTWTGDTSSFTVGDKLFLDTAGALTTTVPSGVLIYQYIGVVSVVDSTNGKIEVNISRAFDFNSIIDNSTAVNTLQQNTSKVNVTLSAMGNLNSLAASAIASVSTYVTYLYGGIVQVTTPPSAPVADLTLNIYGNNTSAYNSTSIIGTVTISSAISANQTQQIGISQFSNLVDLEDGVYIGTSSDVTSWSDGAAKVILFYSQFRP